MLSLETLDLLLAITEGEMIEEMIVGMLAAPQLSVFFKKFPAIRRALDRDLPRWKLQLKERLQEAMVPPALAQEFYRYQQCQLENNTQFYHNLNDTMELLRQLVSPFYEQARALLDAADLPNHPLDDSFQTLFLQRWRISLTLQATMLHHQLLEQEREQLMAELQERPALSGALEPLLSENDTAAGRLWDMSKGQLQRGDYQRLVEYGNFLQQQPELKKLAQQLGRSYQAKAVQQQDAQPEPFRVMVQVPATLPEEVSGIHQSDDILRLLPPELATLGIEELEFEFYRRLLEKRLLSYRLQGDVWQEQILIRQSPTSSRINSRAGRLSSAWTPQDRWAASTNSAPRRSARRCCALRWRTTAAAISCCSPTRSCITNSPPPAASNRRCAFSASSFAAAPIWRPA